MIPKPAPSFSEVRLENPSGEPYDIGRALSRRLTVLVLYRGAWCPYSVQLLKELRNMEPEILSKGFQIIAISPDRPFRVREMLDQMDVPFVVLCDRRNEVARALGLAPVLDGDVARRYAMASALPDPLPGEGEPRLPLPSLVVLGEDGMVYAQVSGMIEHRGFSSFELIQACDEARRRSRVGP
jgi:peroxiredoxin